MKRKREEEEELDEKSFKKRKIDVEKVFEIERSESNFFQKIDFYLRNKRLELALNDLNNWINKFPNSSRSYYFRGMVKRRLCNFEDSLRDYGKAIDIDPKNADAYFGRSVLFCYNYKDYYSALKDINMSISLNPINIRSLHYIRGYALLNLSRFNEAIEDFTKEIENIPSRKMLNISYFGRAISYDVGLKNYLLAIKNYSKSIECSEEIGRVSLTRVSDRKDCVEKLKSKLFQKDIKKW